MVHKKLFELILNLGMVVLSLKFSFFVIVLSFILRS